MTRNGGQLLLLRYRGRERFRLEERTFRVDSPHEHRRKLATLLKHSRYYIANRSYVNKPEFTAGRDEVSCAVLRGGRGRHGDDR